MKRNIVNLIIMFLIIIFSSCEKENVKKDAVSSEIILSINASDRASAYIESNKILSIDNHKFITYLEKKDDIYIVMLVHLIDNIIVESVIVDKVLDNHGGAALALDHDNKIYIVYGGHVEKLKYRKVLNSLSLRGLGEIQVVDEQNPNLDWYTYPSIVFDKYNTMHLCYRAESKNPTNRNPEIRYCRIFSNGRIDIKSIKNSDYYYANYTASIICSNNNIDILYHEYGITKEKKDISNGVYLLRSSDSGETFTSVSVFSEDENTLYYISNITSSNDEINFVLMDSKNPKDFLLLVSVALDNEVHSYDLLKNPVLKKYYTKNKYFPMPYVSMNSIGNVNYIVLANTIDNSWSSVSNRLLYFSCKDKNINIIYDLKDENVMSWLPNIEKNIYGIPSIIYTSNNRVVYTIFK